MTRERRVPNYHVTIDGEVYSIGAPQNLLMLGDYGARLLTDEHGKGNYDLWQVYEFQFPDKKTRRFLVVAIGIASSCNQATALRNAARIQIVTNDNLAVVGSGGNRSAVGFRFPLLGTPLYCT